MLIQTAGDALYASHGKTWGRFATVVVFLL